MERTLPLCKARRRWTVASAAAVLALALALPAHAEAAAKLDVARFDGVGPYVLLALAGLAVTLLAAAALVRGPLARWLQCRVGTAPSALRRAIAAVALGAGPLTVYHALVAPALGMLDGATAVACCFDERRQGVLASADGAWATRDGRLIDLRRGELVAGDAAAGPLARFAAAPASPAVASRGDASRRDRLDDIPAHFGDDKAPSRIAVFSGSAGLAVQLRDGTEVELANPAGNCVVIAEDGPIAAVVVSKRTRSLLDRAFPLRGAGVIDFVDLRTGALLRSVTVARLDGFDCAPDGSGARLVGTAGGARWVLSQERWIKVFEVRLPRPGRPLERALAQRAT